jgi:hypothetical protein
MSLARFYDPTHAESADIVNESSSATLTARNTDSLHTNSGSSGSITLTLPAAVANLRYRFMNVTTNAIRISAAGSDVIGWVGVGSTFASLSNSGEQYACLVLVCLQSGYWAVEGQPTGTWTPS